MGKPISKKAQRRRARRTATATATADAVIIPTETPTNTPEISLPPTETPTEIPTNTPEPVVILPTETPTDIPTATPEPTATETPTPQNVWALGTEIGAISVTEIAIKDYKVMGFTMGNYDKAVTIPVSAKLEEVLDPTSFGGNKTKQVVLRASLGTTQSGRPKLITAKMSDSSLILLLEAHWGYRGSGEWLIVTNSPFAFKGEEKNRLSLFHVMHHVELQYRLDVEVIAFAPERASARGALGFGNAYLVCIPKNFQHRVVLKRTGRLYGEKAEIEYAIHHGTPILT